ncbi:hypothetical protein ACG0Z6_08460 [Roseateles sp. BYS180W]|uniref:Uncharacterized protein n=1 Tax=Roseateles rivi TaxID=3299028 RepID=A0ABW7FVC8_9BURK
MASLQVWIQAPQPLQLALQVMSGGHPEVQVSGEAAFAADVSWLAQNVRWDVAEDLAAVVGPVAAQHLTGLARAAVSAMGQLTHAVSSWRAGVSSL